MCYGIIIIPPAAVVPTFRMFGVKQLFCQGWRETKKIKKKMVLCPLGYF